MRNINDILHNLGSRERQIVEAVIKLGEASVSQVLAEIPDPPTYTSIRTMLQLLVKKGVLQFHNDGKRYLYKIKADEEKIRMAAVKNLLTTFFPGNAPFAIAAILDLVGDQLEPQEIEKIQRRIDETRKETR